MLAVAGRQRRELARKLLLHDTSSRVLTRSKVCSLLLHLSRQKVVYTSARGFTPHACPLCPLSLCLTILNLALQLKGPSEMHSFPCLLAGLQHDKLCFFPRFLASFLQETGDSATECCLVGNTSTASVHIVLSRSNVPIRKQSGFTEN